ncbi:MAG: dephospho-CoA kinase [Alphaproteobacteria bacterium]
MLIIGLTGSIGMGKSTTAALFAEAGVPVYDADAAVHALYAPGGAAVGPIGEAFPEALKDGGIDRAALGQAVLGQPQALKRLEAIIHPLVGRVQLEWLQARADDGVPMVVLDIPLLFETGGNARVDVVVVVSAPVDVQRRRVLEREGMSEEKLDAILAKQLPDAQKRAHADFIIETDRGIEDARHQVLQVLRRLEGRKGQLWPARQDMDP